jgi:diacylglycerol kinase
MNDGFRAFLMSFVHAWRGLRVAFRTEQSFRIQAAFGLAVFAVIWVLPLSATERVILLLAIAAVLVLELLNSMVERMVDLFKPRLHEYVRDIKDLMAATVLLASGFAALIGFMILWPHAMAAIGRL